VTDTETTAPGLRPMMRGGRRLRDGHVLYWWVEVLAILAFYLVYSAIRNANGSHPAGAFKHAKEIISLEHHLGIFHEATIQKWALHFKPLIITANYLYGSLHFVVTIGVGIWLFRKSRRRYLHFPPEIENFDNLLTFTEQWLPQGIVRRNAPPSTSWAYLKVYGIWTSAGLLLYVAIGNQTPAIAIPACILASAGVAWYFGWCGRKTDEKKWKALLPLSGYFFAPALLGRAFKLWTSN